jgi:hypothetical protein
VDINTKILLKRIADLEHELAREIHRQQQQFSYQVKNGKVAFRVGISQVHSKFKVGVIPWLLRSQLRNVLSMPIIYPLLIPFVVLDLSLSIYQQLCFSLYQIPKVKRSNYFVFDHHLLKYLNLIQKLNCFYCSYVSGVIGFAREIAGRTEQYWCPIKHAHKVRHPHPLYINFSDYGDAENFLEESAQLRQSLRSRPSKNT